MFKVGDKVAVIHLHRVGKDAQLLREWALDMICKNRNRSGNA